jgi:hypothetical protein
MTRKMSALLVSSILSVSTLGMAEGNTPAPRDSHTGLSTGQRAYKPAQWTANSTAPAPAPKPTEKPKSPTPAPDSTPKSK